MDRIDALATHSRHRLSSMTGRVLDERPDEELQLIVSEAAATANQPIALISLVLERTQRFRAAVGLPFDLEIAGGTDRAASFCQFVVRDEVPLDVNNASASEQMPQALVQAYGIESYLGVPVCISDVVVGSLCVIGSEVRTSDAALLERMLVLAERASRRLTAMAQTAKTTKTAMTTPLLAKAAAPAFGELKNALSPIMSSGGALRLLAADAAPLARIVKAGARAFSALDVLREAAGAFDEFSGLADDLDTASARVKDNVDVLDAVLADDDGAGNVGEVIAAAMKLAHHATKLVGGVDVTSVCDAVVDYARVSAGLIAVALKEVAVRGKRVVKIRAVTVDDDVLIGIGSTVSDDDAETITRMLKQLRPDADVSCGAGVVIIILRRSRCLAPEATALALQ